MVPGNKFPGRAASQRRANALLVSVGLFALGVIVKVWIAPEWGVREQQALVLPADVQVGGWALTQCQELAIGPNDIPHPVRGMEYGFASNGVVARIEARSYDNLDFEVADQARVIMNYPQKGELHRLDSDEWCVKQTTGPTTALDLVVDACGKRSATLSQFIVRDRQGESTVRKVLNWLIGRGPIRDRRGLWVHLSTPNTERREEAFQQLLYVLDGWQSASEDEVK